jgi:hypothetical protein
MRTQLPEFKNQDDEREFWATADSTEYVDWQSGKREKLDVLDLVRSRATEQEVLDLLDEPTTD